MPARFRHSSAPNGHDLAYRHPFGPKLACMAGHAQPATTRRHGRQARLKGFCTTREDSGSGVVTSISSRALSSAQCLAARARSGLRNGSATYFLAVMRISSARLVTVSSLLFSFLTSRADASESGKAQIRSLICSQSNTCTAYFGAHEVAAGSTCVVQTGGAV